MELGIKEEYKNESMKFNILNKSQSKMYFQPSCISILYIFHISGLGIKWSHLNSIVKSSLLEIYLTSEGKQWAIQNIFEWKCQFKILSIKHTYKAYLQSKFTLDSWYLWKFFLLYLLKITTVYIRNKLKQLR